MIWNIGERTRVLQAIYDLSNYYDIIVSALAEKKTVSEIAEDARAQDCNEVVHLCENPKKARPKCYNGLMFLAAQKGCIETLRQCKRYGADHQSLAMHKAAKNGHIEIMELCAKWTNRPDFDEAMSNACMKGRVEVAKRCKELGATAFASALLVALNRNHIDCVLLCKHWALTCGKPISDLRHIVEESMPTVAYRGHIEAMKLCKKWGKTFDFDEMMVEAARGGNLDAVKLCIKWGGHEFW